MNKKEDSKLVEEATAFLNYMHSGYCEICDTDVGNVCEFCQSLDIIKRLKDKLKDYTDE